MDEHTDITSRHSAVATAVVLAPASFGSALVGSRRPDGDDVGPPTGPESGGAV